MAPRKTRLLFVMPSLNRGGAELQTLSLLKGMDHERYEKHLLCLSGDQGQIEWAGDRDVELHRFHRKHRVDRNLLREMAGLFDSIGPDVVYCALLYSFFNAFWARRMSASRPPLVASVHTTVNRSLKDELFERAIYRLLLPQAQRIVFVSSLQREFWARKYAFVGRLSTVVHNGVDTSHFRPDPVLAKGRIRAALSIPEGADILLCIAAFRPEKGHGVLLEALAGMTEPPFLLLAGDGPKRREIEEAAARLGIVDRVRFLGVVDDVRPPLSIADFSVLPSTAVETFSMAMLESMAMGVPVIGSDLGGMAEAVLPGRTGWLVPPNDAGALRGAIAEALRDKGQAAAMGWHARELVVERFSKERMVGAMESLLDGLIARQAYARSGGAA
jgi:glycosyltransferase involved in cell wall biosynthesis